MTLFDDSFFISLCNTAPLFVVQNESDWKAMIYRDWLPAFHHPSYLRIDNRLVFKIINALQFYQVSSTAVILVRLLCGSEPGLTS